MDLVVQVGSFEWKEEEQEEEKEEGEEESERNVGDT